MNILSTFRVYFVGLIVMAFIVGCAQGSCREIREKAKSENPQQVQPDLKKIPTGAADRIRVFKPDGSLQCEESKGTDAEKMRSELDGIATYKAFKTGDGLMRIQLCGSATGQVNVYEIDRADLSKAQSRGFRQWVNE